MIKKKYMNKKTIILSIVLLIVVIAGISYFIAFKNRWIESPLAIAGNSGIVITSLGNSAAGKISSPLEIAGYTTGKDSWNGFEGQVGIVKLFDDKGKELALGILTATTEWMTSQVYFKTSLTFNANGAESGNLIFYNENPSGMLDKDRKFILPINFAETQTETPSETVKVKVYFNNNKMDPEVSCNKVFPVEREITRIEAIGSAAIWELLKGLTMAEQAEGFFTSINQGVKLQSLNIREDGTAFVDFDEQLQAGVGGSCKVSAIRAQITETLKQFPTVKNVIISINGRTEDILQP